MHFKIHYKCIINKMQNALKKSIFDFMGAVNIVFTSKFKSSLFSKNIFSFIKASEIRIMNIW